MRGGTDYFLEDVLGVEVDFLVSFFLGGAFLGLVLGVEVAVLEVVESWFLSRAALFFLIIPFLAARSIAL